ncbi:MAG: alanine dehydrogenase [Deltaproteobacteria bacterium]|nr:alanine dehydrogenase [Deltaproteobacteria bacterium]MCL5277265.1 alanine dehydrogenase [Deltaproteobacteria bacterium]
MGKTARHVDILFLDQKDVRAVITPEEAFEAVEYAFRMHAYRKVQMPAKIYLDYYRFRGDLRAMPAYIVPAGASGVKIVNSHANNSRAGLPSVMAIFVLVEPETGRPISIMDATYFTDLRTGAAGAVAAAYLSRKDASVLGLVGAGRQAMAQLVAIARVRGIRLAKVCAKTNKEAVDFADRMRGMTDIPVEACDMKDVCDADIVSTTTPSRRPIVRDEWILPGTHINAVGADAPGKQELEPGILKRARVFLDDFGQATHSGEVNVGLSTSEIVPGDIQGEIGEVVTGKKKGRVSRKDITIFDSTGLAVQDVSIALKIYRNALKVHRGKVLRLF